MFNVCPACGEYSETKEIVAPGMAQCPHCGHLHRFRMLPLFVLTGASGVGKSATCLNMVELADSYVVMETDILWRAEFDKPEEDWRTYRNLWLRMAKNIGQAGKPVLLAGSAVPSQFETCPERRYFRYIHYLALVCEEDVLARRLRGRPDWRGWDNGAIDRMQAFNRWFLENGASGSPPIALLDNTHLSTAETALLVDAWVRDRLDC